MIKHHHILVDKSLKIVIVFSPLILDRRLVTNCIGGNLRDKNNKFTSACIVSRERGSNDTIDQRHMEDNLHENLLNYNYSSKTEKMKSNAQNPANARRNQHQNLRIPGILSPSSPPECRFLLIALTGELLTNVGPLETGLGKAGVEILFDLEQR